MKRLETLHRVENACYSSLNARWVIPNTITRPSRSPPNGKRIAGPNWFESTPARATERGYSPNELNMSRPMTRPISWRGMASWIAVKSRTVMTLLATPPISIHAMAPMTPQVGRSAIEAATIRPARRMASPLCVCLPSIPAKRLPTSAPAPQAARMMP